jgi:bifunctional UDP-N-acetylglucosamine pyrophosphorylase/glucosamine-1-phosphate N-acetyltransferase
MSTNVIILAAGISSRMNSNTPKVMHLIAERPALGYILETVSSISPEKIILVTSPNMEQVRDFANSEVREIVHVIQEKPLGTGDAIKPALQHLDDKGDTIILYGDAPLVTQETLNILKNKSTDAVVVAFNSDTPEKNGRVVTYNGDLLEIVEFNDATDEEKAITLCNSGIYSIKNSHLKELIPLIKNNNVKKEFYLTDIVKLLVQREISCSVMEASEDEMKNFNTQEELSLVQNIMQRKIKSRIMKEGATIYNPETSFFAYDLQVQKDCLIYPNVFIGKNVTLGRGVTIMPFSHIEGAKIEDEAAIGPFASSRPST